MTESSIKTRPTIKPKTGLGLDIGSHSIKVLEITDHQNKLTLQGFGTKKILGLKKEGIAQNIQALLSESNIKSKEVTISISGPSVIIRFVQMPRMTLAELKGAVRFEAEKFIPFDIKDCVVDFQILKSDPKENRMDILLVAAKRGAIDEKIRLVESAGLSVAAIDVDSFAASNAFLSHAHSADSEKTIAVLNIGATFTNVAIIKNSALSFARDIAIGGNNIDIAIERGLALEKGTAEDIKLLPEKKISEVANASKPILSNILDEIRLSFSYYENQYGHGIEEIYLSGGCSLFTGLSMLIAETFGVKASFWNPFDFLEIDITSEAKVNLTPQIQASYAIAAGLALR